MAQILFGCVFILDSLYLVLCYATFDFFGARNSPFFGWLRGLNLLMEMLYFPSLCGALLTVSLGSRKQEARRLASVFLVAQLLAGGAFILLPGQAGLFGWALLFGPYVRTIVGYVPSYPQAIACLIPVIWISMIHIATSWRAGRGRAVSRPMSLVTFLLAGLTVSLLYQGLARMRLAGSQHSFSWVTLGFVIAVHLVSFTLMFLVLGWIRVIASRFASSGLIQFGLRAAVAVLVLAALIRKIIFALLGFNNRLADLYAVLFSLAAVLSIAALTLMREEQLESDGAAQERSDYRSTFWGLGGPLVVTSVFFYIFIVRLSAVDWEHILSSVAALITWCLILWLCFVLRRSSQAHTTRFLVVLSFLAGTALVGLRVAGKRLENDLEQYSDYNPSFFAIQQAAKPAVQDEKYASWYKFLSLHANIRWPVQAPQTTLTKQLTPTEIKKPDIFVFVMDALRRDYVSVYNPAVQFTPALGAFARESVVFDHAYSPYAGTELAVPAIFSGIQQVNKPFPEPVRRLNHLDDMLNVDGYELYTSYNPIVAALADPSDRITNLSAGLGMDEQQEFHHIIKKLEDAILERRDHKRPIFVYSQPANVHTLYLTWHRGQVQVKPHPGFDDAYASGVERMDASFGEFVDFLKKEGLYENSIIIVTADHGESLGEMGRHSHVSNLTPEVIDIPLIIHLPQWQKSALVWNTSQVATLHDITPTLYYLLGHRPLNQGSMIGHSLFASTAEEQTAAPPDHYFLMSSYMPVFGILSGDGKSLFYVDATLNRNYYYDLEDDPQALSNKVTSKIRDHYELLLRQDLENIDKFYGLTEQQLAGAQR